MPNPINIVECPICHKIKGSKGTTFNCCAGRHSTSRNLKYANKINLTVENELDYTQPKNTNLNDAPIPLKEEPKKMADKEIKTRKEIETKITEPEIKQLPPLNKPTEPTQEEYVCGGCGYKLGKKLPLYCGNCGVQLKEDE